MQSDKDSNGNTEEVVRELLAVAVGTSYFENSMKQLDNYKTTPAISLDRVYEGRVFHSVM